MKKYLLIFLSFVIFIPKYSKSQNNNAAATATAVAAVAGGIAAIGGAILSIEQLKERVELTAIEWVLTNHPDLKNISIKTLDFDGKKLKDMSSVTVITFKVQEFVPADNPKLNGKKYVILGFTSYGWVNEQGVDFSRLNWFLVDIDEWTNMMVAYSKMSSAEKNEAIIKDKIKNGLITNKGIRINSKLVIPFYSIGGDMYISTDYSPDMKFVYNEKSLGIFLKSTNDLVQIGRDDIIKIHEYFYSKD